MGAPKSLLELGGEPLVARMARLVEPLVRAVTVVGAPDLYRGLSLPVIPDRSFGQENNRAHSPLVGIATALSATVSAWNLILACDLPYLTGEWIDWLLARAADSRGQIVMPRSSTGLEPLAALYRRECADPILRALKRGTRKVTEAISQLEIEYVNHAEWSALDPDGTVLKNMNTPEDYREAKLWWERKNRGA